MQKITGMVPEECVILAIALDFHTGKDKSPLASEIVQIATKEEQSGAMTFTRILIVVDKQAG